MSEKTKTILSWVFKGVAALFAVLAFIFMFALPGISASIVQDGITMEGHIKMSAFVFGGGNISASFWGLKIDVMSFKGGLSIFGLVAFILLVIGIALTVLSLVLRKQAKLYALLGCIVLLLSGVFAFLLTVAGTSATITIAGETQTVVETWKEFVSGLHLGTGAILFGVFNILAAGILLVDAVMFENHKQDDENRDAQIQEESFQ